MRVAALVLLAGCATLAGARRGWPVVDGDFPASGAHGRLSITRDAHGVPHVEAGTEEDAWFGLGFVHAQDRLFQADLSRRLAFGGLAAWLGDEHVDLDAFMTALDLRRRAERALRVMSPEARVAVAAYTRGVNAGAASLPGLPAEYRRLGVDFRPWTETDALAQAWLSALFQQRNLADELLALALREAVDTDRLDALLRPTGEGPHVDLAWDNLRHAADTAPFSPEFAAFRDVFGRSAGGSVAWASPDAAGVPSLANAPRLSGLPYVASVRGGALAVAGATLPGAPGVVAGHDGHVAWGVTSAMADTVDVAIFDRHGAEGYVHAGEPKALVPLTVRVPTRRGSVTRTVWWTDVGPAITGLDAPVIAALQWSGLSGDDQSTDALLALNHARSVGEAIAAVDRPSASVNTWVFADARGVGWQVAGGVVRRRGYTGRVPYPASSADYGWNGWLHRLPGGVGAPAVAAEARPDLPWADAVSTAFAPPWRHDRITHVLALRDARGPAADRALLGDLRDLHAAAVLPGLLGPTPAGGDARLCHELLSAWDHEAHPASPGAAAWAVFQRELAREALVDDLGEVALDAWLGATPPGRTPADGTLAAFADPGAVERALAATCASLRAELGPDPVAWSWGALHRLELRHPLERRPRAVLPWGGSAHTVNAGGHRLDDLSVTAAASLRIVVPMAEPSAATFACPGGQSGHPGHPSSADLLERWVAGDQVPLWFTPEQVRANAVSRLNLRPR